MKKVILILMVGIMPALAFDGEAQRFRPNDRKEGQTKASRNDNRESFNKFSNNRHDGKRREQLVRNTSHRFDQRNKRSTRVRRGVRPSDRHIWVAGYWRFDHRYGRKVWVNGYWSIQRRHHKWRTGYYASSGWINGGWIRVY